MPGKRILSDTQLEIMCEKREAGWSYLRIAQYFTARGTPIHDKTIRWQCLRLGAYSPKAPHFNIGKKVPGSRGTAFTPAEDAVLLRLEAQGHSKASIARSLGRPPNSVTGRLYTLAFHDEKIRDYASR